MKDIAKNNFIGEFMIDTDLCDKMIELHNSISLATKEQLAQEIPMLMSKKEIFGVGDGDPKGKTSTDLAIHPVVFTDPKSCPPKNRPHVRVALSYWMELQMCMNKYKELLTNSNTERWIGSLNKIHINDHMIIQQPQDRSFYAPLSHASAALERLTKVSLKASAKLHIIMQELQ